MRATGTRSTPVNVPRVYALADRERLGPGRLGEAVERMADGGVRWIQIRAKDVPDGELADEIELCCRRLEGRGVTLWINDRPDLARIYPFQGVHLGQDDLTPQAAREVVGEHAWIGRSTHRELEVDEAEADPEIDAVAIGPVFATTGKRAAEPVVGLEGVRRARSRTSKPLIAIGGIGADNLAEVLEAGADCVAMLGAVCDGNIEKNCTELVALAQESV